MSNNGEPTASTPAGSAEPPVASSPAADPPPVHTIADGSERKLHPRCVVVWRVIALIWVAAIAGVNFIGITIALLNSFWSLSIKLLLLGGWALLFGAVAGYAVWWPGVRYRHISYRIDSRGLTILRGVFWRSIASVPRSRIQHTDVSQGPVQRNFDLATLIVHTAGTQNASISLSGLPHEDALRIRDYLIEVGEEDAV